jgi:enhancing lycopene biosynthesis protein 2
MEQKRVGVLLSGCGNQDGSEIHESVLTLLALDRAGVQALCMAPDMPQAKVMDHTTKEPMDQTRSVLVEAGRIARGDIRDVAEVKEAQLDALVLPGGFGAALNLCTFGEDGPECDVQPQVRRLIEEMHAAKKPIVAICIAPVVVARVLGPKKVKVTIGTDGFTSAQVERTGARHESCQVGACVVDADHKVITTPAYMLGKRITEVAAGIDAAIHELSKMLGIV